MDKGAEHHIDLRVCVTLASSVGVTTSSPTRASAFPSLNDRFQETRLSPWGRSDPVVRRKAPTALGSIPVSCLCPAQLHTFRAVRLDVHKFSSSEPHFSSHFKSSPEVQSAANAAEALQAAAWILTRQVSSSPNLLIAQIAHAGSLNQPTNHCGRRVASSADLKTGPSLGCAFSALHHSAGTRRMAHNRRAHSVVKNDIGANTRLVLRGRDQ